MLGAQEMNIFLSLLPTPTYLKYKPRIVLKERRKEPSVGWATTINNKSRGYISM